MRSRFGTLVNWVALIGGLAAIFYPAFIDEHLSITQIIISLFSPRLTLAYAMRLLCAIWVGGALYILITNRIYRDVPISVIWTKFHIYFETENGSRVRVVREQALRANRSDITAYFMSSRPTNPNGRIIEDSFSVSTYCGDTDFSDRLDFYGNEARGFEIIHLFGQQLPYAWYMPLIPMRLLNKDPKQLFFGWLRNKIAVRRMTSTYQNEFNTSKPTLSFTASIYPQHNFEITMHCVPGQILNDLQAMRIKNNGVINVRFRPQTDGTTQLVVERLRNETLRISWTGPTE